MKDYITKTPGVPARCKFSLINSSSLRSVASSYSNLLPSKKETMILAAAAFRIVAGSNGFPKS